MQEASSEREDVQDERRGPDPTSAQPTPLEHVASIERAIDKLLVGVEDPYVKESLQDSVTRIEPKFKDLVCRVRQSHQSAVQQDAPIVLNIHPSLNPSATDWRKKCTMPADTIRSLSEQVYRYRTQHIALTEMKLMSARLDRVMKRVV